MSQALIDKILKTAHTEAEEIEKEAMKRAAASENVILKRGTERADAVLKTAEQDAAQEIKTANLMCELEKRKAVLKTKRDIISTVYDKAFDKLCALSTEEKTEFLYSVITKNAPESVITLTVPASEKQIYTPAFIKRLEDGISERMSAEAKVTLSDTPADFKGGVLMTGEKCDVDASFEQIMSDARDLYENDISEMLFGVMI